MYGMITGRVAYITPEVYLYKGNALKAIQAKIDDRQAALADSTAAAVATLTNFEVQHP